MRHICKTVGTQILSVLTNYLYLRRLKLNHGVKSVVNVTLRHLLSLCSQTDVRLRVLEAKHQEEKLKMQQRHDAEVEKVRRETRRLQHHLP